MDILSNMNDFNCSDARAAMQILISQSSLESIHDPFVKLGFDQIKEKVAPHVCPHIEVTSSETVFQQMPSKSKSFPHRMRPTKFRKSVRSLPGDGTVVTSSNSESDYIYMDECEAVGSSSSMTSISEKKSHQSYWKDCDFLIYKAMSACVKHPVLLPCKHAGTQQNHSLLNKEDSEVALILGSFLRKLCKHPSKKHRDYQHIISQSNKEQSLQSELFYQLQVSEKNEHLYYKQDEFCSVEDNRRWQKIERDEINSFISRLPGLDNPDVYISTRNRCEDYRTLLSKVVNYELSNVTKNRSTLTIPETSLSPSTSSASLPRVGKILSSKSSRLLAEFLRYRVSPLTQHVMYFQCLLKCMDSNILALGDLETLEELQHCLKEILNFLTGDCGVHVILKSEVNLMNELTERVIEDLKCMMCSFLTTWKPTEDQLSTSLALLRSCYTWQQLYDEQKENDYPFCVEKWFQAAVIEGYESQKHLKCDCEDPCITSNSACLHRAIQYSMETICNGSKEGFQSIFEPYIENVSKSSAAVLYTSVLKDVQDLENDSQAAKSFEDKSFEFVSNIHLPSKLFEFEECVLKTCHTPSMEDLSLNWRTVFHEKRRFWMREIRSRMSKSMLLFIRDHGKGCSVDLNKEEVFLVPEMPDTRTSSCSDRRKKSVTTDNANTHVTTGPTTTEGHDNTQRMRMNTMVGCGVENEPRHEISEFMTLDTSSRDNFSVIRPSFTFTRSALDLVLLINRFIAFIEGLVQPLYNLPYDLCKLPSAATNKDLFCIQVFEVMSRIIKQYCDCMLNLDLCNIPEKRVLQYVTKEKKEQLKRRALNGTVNCCRHQMENVKCSTTEADDFSTNSCYAKMCRRINNVSLLLGGRHVLFEKLCRALQISETIASSAMTSSRNSSMHERLSDTDIYRTRTTESLYSEGSDSSQDTVVYVGPSNSSDKPADNPDSESLICHDETIVESGTEIVNSLSELPTDGNNNNGQKSSEQAMLPHTSSVDVQLLGVGNKPPRLRRSYTVMEGRNDHGRSRQRSCTDADLVDEQESILVLGITPLLDRCGESVTTCARSLCGVLSWRVTKTVFGKLLSLLDKPNLNFTRSNCPNTTTDVEICEQFFEPVTSDLYHVLNQLSTLVRAEVLLQMHQTVWKLFLEIFKTTVMQFGQHSFNMRKRSFVLLNLFRFFANIFSSFELLQEDEMTEDIQPALKLLELYTLATEQIIGIHKSLENQPIKMEQLLMEIRRKHKSFSGRQLLEHVIKTYPKLPPSKAKSKAQKKCEELIRQKLISLLFVREKNTSRLPDLVDDSLSSNCSSTPTSSSIEISETSSSITSDDSFTSPIESDSDGSHDVTDPTEFYADDDHFYVTLQAIQETFAVHGVCDCT
ncbi:uncharacterized protein LOC100182250 [Ciona intestinalis]